MALIQQRPSDKISKPGAHYGLPGFIRRNFAGSRWQREYQFGDALRFKLKDSRRANNAALKQSDEQYQVVTGNHVGGVYQMLTAAAGLGEESRSDFASAMKSSLFARFIDIVYGIFTPFVGVVTACGI